MSFLPAGAPKSFWALLIEQGKVASPVVGYYIDESEERGGITFGGYDASRVKGELEWISVVGNGERGTGSIVHWQTPWTGLTVGDSEITIPADHDLDFDTGTSLAVLPHQLAENINAQLGLGVVNSTGMSMWGVPCEAGRIPTNLPNLTITLDGATTMTFTPTEYMWVRTTSSVGPFECISGFTGKKYSGTGSSSSQPSILGNLFLRKYYTIFDYGNKRIGIAEAVRRVNVKGNLTPGPEPRTGVAGTAAIAYGTSSAGRMTPLRWMYVLLSTLYISMYIV